jgi:hypothetical protein
MSGEVAKSGTNKLSVPHTDATRTPESDGIRPYRWCDNPSQSRIEPRRPIAIRCSVPYGLCVPVRSLSRSFQFSVNSASRTFVCVDQ